MNLVRTAAVAALLTTAAAAGCAPETRYQVLSFFFDGVPKPGEKRSEQRGTEVAAPGALPKYGEHGPYAAKLCDACHLQGSNNLVVAREELCIRCHVLKLDRKILHGPLASGNCEICHGPHGSSNRFLLVADAKEFCVYCHDKSDIMKRAAHQGMDAECTVCHDAHGSENEFLLK
jgi:predicted CXXCH cytochrome family protein